jgi:hypothetical protein
MTITATIDTTIDQYFAAWNEPDRERRVALAELVLTPGSRYVDPLADVRGPDGFADMVEAVRQQAPGHTVRLSSVIDQHHDQVRFAWEFVAADGSIPFAGIDVCAVTDDGRFESVSGFFGAAPAVVRVGGSRTS